ncbi:MAG: rhodanese-like domain-containing protein [Chitinophagaceae bacterium]
MFGLEKLFGTKTDFKKLVEQGCSILDVRTPAEFREGNIPGSINIPLDQLNTKINELKKKNKTVITCCKSGMRSATATSMLNSSGVIAFNGGSWNSLIKKIV